MLIETSAFIKKAKSKEYILCCKNKEESRSPAWHSFSDLLVYLPPIFLLKLTFFTFKWISQALETKAYHSESCKSKVGKLPLSGIIPQIIISILTHNLLYPQYNAYKILQFMSCYLPASKFQFSPLLHTVVMKPYSHIYGLDMIVGLYLWLPHWELSVNSHLCQFKTYGSISPSNLSQWRANDSKTQMLPRYRQLHFLWMIQ